MQALELAVKEPNSARSFYSTDIDVEVKCEQKDNILNRSELILHKLESQINRLKINASTRQVI